MSKNHQHSQQNQHQHTSQPHQGHRPPPGNPLDQRKEFLWRERVRLELQVQALLARQWQHLQERKTALGNQLPRMASQMIIASLVGIRQLPSERLHLYEKERIAQEEYRLQQDIMRCQGDAAGLYTHIEVLDFELSLL
jgi:hypothetical protein